MSRATVDLQSVRFFLGYGLVFMMQSALTIVLAAVAMFVVEPGAGGDLARSRCRSSSSIAARYGRRSRPALQEVQQRIAELTAEVEENVSGVRVVKAFAREERQLRALRARRSARVFDQAMVSTRLQAFYNPFIGFLPQLGLAAILFFGGRQVIDGDADARPVHRVLRLPADAAVRRCARSASRSGMAQRATASGARLFQILDREPRDRRAAGRAAAAGGLGPRRAARRRRCATRAPRAPALHDVDARRRRPGTTVALVGATGSGKTTLVQLIPRLYDVDRAARCSSTAPTCATSTPRRCARAIAVVDDDPFLFSRQRRARTSPTRGADAHATRRSSRPRAARRPTTSSRACPRATTRASASAA